MVSIEKSSTDWGHISVTILSKSGLRASSRDGVLSKSYESFLCAIFQSLDCRCEAPPENLDDSSARLRSHERTDFIIKCFDPGTIWDDFGIRYDVVVCFALNLMNDQ